MASRKACRKNLEDTVPIFAKAPEHTNITLDAVSEILAAHEDIWIFAFARTELLSAAGSDCAGALQRLGNLTAEVGPLVKLGIVSVTAQEAKDNEDDFFAADELASDRCAHCTQPAGGYQHQQTKSVKSMWLLHANCVGRTPAHALGAALSDSALEVQVFLPAADEAVWGQPG